MFEAEIRLVTSGQKIEVDEMGIELGAIHTREQCLTADVDAATAAHAGTVNHDRIQRCDGTDTCRAGHLSNGSHHGHRSSRKDDINRFGPDHVGEGIGDKPVATVGAVVSARHELGAGRLELLLQQDMLFGAPPDDRNDPISGRNQRSHHGVSDGRADPASDHDRSAVVFNLRRLPKRASDIRERISGLKHVEGARGPSNPLHEEGDGALSHIGFSNGQWYSLSVRGDPHNHELACLVVTDHMGCGDADPPNPGPGVFCFNNAIHRDLLSLPSCAGWPIARAIGPTWKGQVDVLQDFTQSGRWPIGRHMSAASSPRVAPLSIADSHAPFVRLALLLAVLSGILLSGAWIATREPTAAWLAAGAWSWAVAAVVMIRTDRENAPAMLGVAVVVVTLDGLVSDLRAVHTFVSLSVILIGVALVIFIRGRALWFLPGYAVLVATVHLMWLGWTGEALAEGGVGAAGFVVGAVGLRWLRDRSMDSASRFLNLFERAPVSLWEEDYSRVGEWLDELRAQGVSDLRTHLIEDPAALREGMSRIEVVRVNNAAARFLEVDDPAALVGPLKPETFPKDALPSLADQFEAIWEGRDHVTTEVSRGYTVQGTPLDGLLHWAVPRRFGKLDLSRVIVSVVDITAQKNARRDLERSLKSKDELIATVSHELRTPLTTVVGLSSELSSSYDQFDRAEAQELLMMISDQSLEVATIVEDLLVAARAESGLLKVTMEPVDLHLETKTTLRGLEIEEEVDCHTMGVVATVNADSGRVRQVLRNLLVNARRYGTRPVRVVVRNHGDMVAVEVRDRGEPIPLAERQAIFERYYRARQTPGVTASVGLGLTVSRELARIMGGDLTYSHDGESVFKLTLPIPMANARPEAS